MTWRVFFHGLAFSVGVALAWPGDMSVLQAFGISVFCLSLSYGLAVHNTERES